MQARLGRRVKWSKERHGRIEHSSEGVLSTGLGRITDAVPDELGRVGFWVPYPAIGFMLDPRVVTGAREDHGLLRVEMVEGLAFLIETVEPAT
jgi:hypothetical protein